MKKLQSLLKKLLSYLPTSTPVTMEEYEAFERDVIDLSGLTATDESLRFAVAAIFINMGAQRSLVTKNAFVKTLRVSASKQFAGQVFHDIKTAQIERQKQAMLAAQKQAAQSIVEATTVPEASNGETKV